MIVKRKERKDGQKNQKEARKKRTKLDFTYEIGS
jgi:hypothetical protein